MSCYSPLICDKIKYDDGEVVMKHFRKSTEEERRLHPLGVIEHFSGYGSLDTHGEILRDNRGFDFSTIEIGCGDCLGCRLDHSLDWAQRIMNEVRFSNDCWFITFTYDDDHLPFDEDSWMPTLEKDAISVFNKRLRSALHYRGLFSKFRFYMCGEYGSGYRPHYHVIYFDLPLFDLQPFTVRNGNKYYISDFISKYWKNGYILVGKVTFESAAYVARYTLKKQDDITNDPFTFLQRVEPFTNMSRRKGIGKEYYLNSFEEIYRTDSVLMHVSDRIQRLKPARYYDKLFDIDYPDRLEEIKAKRQAFAAQAIRDKLAQTNLTLDELRDHDLQLKKDQISRLRRDLD